MSSTADGTVVTNDDADYIDLTYAPGGALSPAGRAHAIKEALPVLGRHFQKVGTPDRLGTYQSLGVAATPSDELDRRLIAGLRLRAALAAAVPVLDAIAAISRQPSFRYALTSSESVGHLGGTLDIPAYVTRRFVDGGPPVYPISEVSRSVLTPENHLAAYASLWMLQELQETLIESRAPKESPEAVQASRLRHQLIAAVAQPALAPCRTGALDVLQRGRSKTLLQQVEVRLRRGEISHRDRYQRLYDLVVQLQTNGPTGHAGEATWSFYDRAFDTRLFEMWCLFVTAKELSKAMATDLPALEESWAGSGLAFRWERPAGTLEMYTQKSLPRINAERQARWVRRGTQQAMRGIPDIVVQANHRYTGETRFALLDAKLRQRSSPPTEELYKLLGYFDNFGLTNDPQGAILFHDPNSTNLEVALFDPAVDTEHGQLIAAPLNPANQAQTQSALVDVTDMLLGLLDLPPATRNNAEGDEGTDSAGGDPSDAHVRRMLDEVRAIKVQLLPETLEASRRRMKAALGQRVWECLTDDTQDMLATAENIGFTMPSDADFSGPVLGAICPLEVLLDAELIAPAKERLTASGANKIGKMLGQQLEATLRAIDGSSEDHHRAIRDEAVARNMRLPDLRVALLGVADLNRDYRRRAAHKEKLSSGDWTAVYQKVVSGETLLPLLTRALNLHRVAP